LRMHLQSLTQTRPKQVQGEGYSHAKRRKLEVREGTMQGDAVRKAKKGKTNDKKKKNHARQYRGNRANITKPEGTRRQLSWEG